MPSRWQDGAESLGMELTSGIWLKLIHLATQKYKVAYNVNREKYKKMMKKRSRNVEERVCN